MYMIFEELENNVVDWGIRKGILGDLELDSEIDTRKKKQLLKFEEEAGEMVEAVLENNVDRVRDEMGDVLVTLTIQANLWGLSLTECLDEAYNKINVRTGHMIDGVFVKDE
jgi:NTP pyrophosphatase (non-canonical NTP hydrolase)|tara:strand:+ start:1732 stop:2064 length:333 start_codon:yes stop_codon:yes gene_type:complete